MSATALNTLGCCDQTHAFQWDEPLQEATDQPILHYWQDNAWVVVSTWSCDLRSSYGSEDRDKEGIDNICLTGFVRD